MREPAVSSRTCWTTGTASGPCVGKSSASLRTLAKSSESDSRATRDSMVIVEDAALAVVAGALGELVAPGGAGASRLQPIAITAAAVNETKSTAIERWVFFMGEENILDSRPPDVDRQRMNARFAPLLACFALSGFAALLYQTVWAR